MKLFCIAAVLFLTPSMIAQDAILGSWSCTSEDVRHTKLDWVMTVSRAAMHLNVHLEGGRDNDRFDLEDVRFDGSVLTARLTINPPDDFVAFTLTLKANELYGMFDGKNSGTGPFICHRGVGVASHQAASSMARRRFRPL